MFVIRNMTPPVARKERAGNSMKDKAEGKDGREKSASRAVTPTLISK